MLLKTMERNGLNLFMTGLNLENLNIYRESEILRCDSVAAESIIVKLLNLNG